MDLNKLTMGDRVIAISGVLLLIFSFFPWFEGTIDGLQGSDTRSAWGAGFALIGVLLGIALVVITVLPAFGVDLPSALAGSKTVLILCAVTFLLILIVVLTAKMEFEGIPDDLVNTSREIGAWLGLLASIGILAGGFLKWKEAPATPPTAPPPAA